MSNKNATQKRIKQHQQRVYANPLPILIDQRPSTFAVGVCIFGKKSIINPQCIGTYVSETQSVWVTNERDTRVLWTRGFFGKGSLSRSEPTWADRQKKLAVGDKPQPTAEEITSKRRVERNKMKIERAKVLTEAQLAAEAAFGGIENVKQSPPIPAEHGETLIVNDKVPNSLEQSSPPKWEPLEPYSNEEEEDLQGSEHLQLTLQEAFFLSWSIGCLRIINPKTNKIMDLKEIWSEFKIAPSITSLNSNINQDYLKRTDNPFIINYALYHHYRSLGWVIKLGIKFCVDLVLYKRGPVFHHAEFAVVLCPTYENEDDKKGSPFYINDQRLSWQWLNTINRVNSQAKKTLILAYVRIPSQDKMKGINDIHEIIKLYKVKEIVVKRFVAARNRDN